MYKIESPAKDANLPASILPTNQPTNMGTPTATPATKGKCHFLDVLLKAKKELICDDYKWGINMCRC